MPIKNTHKLLAGVLALVIVAGLGTQVFAEYDKKDETPTTKIIHLGYLQLAAHDFFDMNRTTEIDNENGKLDLSTVLFNPQKGYCSYQKSLIQKNGCALYDEGTIANGGEIRSVENIMISTASAEVGEKYLQYVEDYGEKKAYDKTIEFYHEQIKIAYEESFHLKFPNPAKGEVTNLHNLAIRAGHDFLPAKIMFDACPLPDAMGLCSLFIIFPLGEKLSEEEKMQPSSPVDGMFDEEFLGIKFCPVPPDFCITVDLLEADQSFGEQFGLGADTFDEFMASLEDGGFDKNDKVSKLLKEAFSRGIYLG